MPVSDYSDLYKKVGAKYGVDPALLMAQGDVESGGDPAAYNDETGASGLAQIIPATAQSLKVDPTKPAEAIDGQARLMAQNIKRYGDVASAVSAYHGGTDKSNWGPKTQAYTEKVLGNYKMAADPVLQEMDQFDKAATPAAATATGDPILSEMDQFDKNIAAEAASPTKAVNNISDKKESPNILGDILKSQPSVAVGAVNEIPSAVVNAISFGSQLNQQIRDKLHNLYSDNKLTDAQRDQNIKNAAVTTQYPTLNSLTGGNLQGPLALGFASAINRLNPDSNLSFDDLAAASKDYTPEQAAAALHQPQTGLGREAADAEKGVLQTMATGTGPLTAVGGYAGSKIANSLSPNNPLAQLGGAAVGGGIGTAAENIARPAALPLTSSAEIKEAAQKKFAEADAAGSPLPAASMNSIVDKAKDLAPSTDFQKDIAKNNPVAEMADTLEKYRDKPLSFRDATALDDELTDRINGQINPTTRQVNNAGRQLQQLQQHLRDTMIDPEIGGSSARREAQQLWSQQLKLKDIENIQSNSENATNPNQALRTGFKQLAKKASNGRSPWSSDEIDALNRGARSGIGTDLANLVGSRLNAMLAGGVYGPVGYGAGFLASEAGRSVAEKMQMSRYNDAVNAVAKRPVVQNALTGSRVPSYTNHLVRAAGLPIAIGVANQQQ